MITLQLSDKMAQALWEKTQYKKHPAYVYLRNKLFESTGFPQVVKELKKGEDLQVELETLPTHRIGKWFVKFGMFLIRKSINVESVKGGEK